MNFEEIQQIIEQMLGVQRALQESQLRDREDIDTLVETARLQREDIDTLVETAKLQREDIDTLVETAKLQNTNIERLLGYSITNASEHLDIEERFRVLESRLQHLEDRQER
jgi:NADP-dependent 3-hydroxy acid dehydrogenase YdfG